MKSLFNAIKNNKKGVILGPILKLIEAVFDLFVPIIVAIIIDKGINLGDDLIIKQYGTILIILAFIGVFVAIIAQYFAATVSVKAGSYIRKNLFRKIEYLPLKCFENQGKAKLINNLTNDTYQIQNGLNLFLRLALRSPLIVFGSCIAAFYINKEIGCIFLEIVIIISVMIFVFSQISVNKFKKVQNEKDNLLDITKEQLFGAKEIRAFRLEKEEIETFKAKNNLLATYQNKAYNSSSILNILNYIVINMGIIAILYFGAINVNVGFITQGELVALLNYAFQILTEIVKLANLLMIVPKSIVSCNRVDEVMNLKNDFKKSIQSVPDEVKVSLEFKNVSFSYSNGENKNVLDDISFSVKEGETLGIIGGISSGKTTLVNLIDRLYEINSGEILLNEIDIRDYNINFYRKNISIVTQNKAIFSDTIRNNILFGNNNISNENLNNAIELSELSDFVNGQELKTATFINEQGSNLSGGQAKRLMIARAVARNPKILILDDAMSALDNLTELKVLYNLKTYSADKILIMVSQKINTIKNMDKILVLDYGKIVGYDNHSNLLKNCPLYKEIYKSQN